MNLLAHPTPDALLKRTVSRCPTCREPAPAEVWRVGGEIHLRRVCPAHGPASVVISSDARFYWLAQGKPENACCGGGGCGDEDANIVETPGNALRASDGTVAGTLGRNAAAVGGAAPFEQLSTCLALIEIVDSCNLACPTCYADSPVSPGGVVQEASLEDIQRRVQGVIDRKGPIEILQLSGGEPTLHTRFFELLEWLIGHPRIGYVLLNTNGVRIARDDGFVDRLAKTFRPGKMQAYLQWDGPQEAGQRFLRGADLRATREKALTRLGAIRLPVTLAMTVTPDSLPHIWESVEFGLRFPHVRGVAFQPMFGSGRVPVMPGGRRVNTADVILAALEQSGGKLRAEDFTPLPCGDPNCATTGYLFKLPGGLGVRSASEFIDFASLQGFLRDKVRYSLEDLARCGCENEPLGELLKQFELDETHTFRLFIKPFMDATTWDEDRIDRCCTHVIRPDGKLDSFCRYYSGFDDTRVAPDAEAGGCRGGDEEEGVDGPVVAGAGRMTTSVAAVDSLSGDSPRDRGRPARIWSGLVQSAEGLPPFAGGTPAVPGQRSALLIQ